MTLTEFLLARIADDEAYALDAIGEYARHSASWGTPSTGVVDLGDPDVDGLIPFGDGPVAEHVAHWDPARVLAECEAKRAIIALHDEWPVLIESEPEYEPGLHDTSMTYRMTKAVDLATRREYVRRFGAEPMTTPMLRAMASVYADHPDYAEEWRP